MMLVWHSAASRNGEEQRFCKAVTSHVPSLVMLSGAPRLHGQAYRISSAQSKHPEKVSVYIPHQGIFRCRRQRNRLGARNRFPPYIPGLCVTIAASGSYGLTLRDTLWGEFPRATFLPQALSGCFDCAPIRLEAADFLQALRST